MSERFSSVIILILLMISIWSFSQFNKEKKRLIRIEKELSQTKRDIDSLESEIFVLDLKLFRYERAHEILKKEDSSAGSHFSDIISDETE